MGEADNRGLGGAVDSNEAFAAAAGLRSHVDDLAPLPTRNHALCGCLEGEEQALDVDAENPVVADFRHLDDRRHIEDRGVVDENVDASPSLDDTVDRSLNGDCLGDVERDREALVAMTCGGFLSLSQGNVGDGDARSFGDIAIGDRGADAARAAGDERDFVLELHRGAALVVIVGPLPPRIASAQDLSDR
jgi:hypothetical protein